MARHYVTEDDPEWDVSDIELDPELTEIAREIAAGPRLQKGDDPGRPPFPKLPEPGQTFVMFVPAKMAAAMLAKKQAEEAEEGQKAD